VACYWAWSLQEGCNEACYHLSAYDAQFLRLWFLANDWTWFNALLLDLFLIRYDSCWSLHLRAIKYMYLVPQSFMILPTAACLSEELTNIHFQLFRSEILKWNFNVLNAQFVNVIPSLSSSSLLLLLLHQDEKILLQFACFWVSKLVG